MNKEEKNKKIQETESRVKAMLPNFIAKDNKNGSNFTWRNISKVQIENYIGQDEVSLLIYFYSSGSGANNKPYTYHKKVSLEIATNFIVKLNEGRKADSSIADDEIDPISGW